ncbi:GOLPH3/VPS74 family protein [Sabulicella rubraurantiaca]|uniref:GOLPH3/VPS74 family protein n=1 Tax=Sabulicella rubraurantiaca TaxID=2811429 RepID=UPI001A965319|nr:GPP34 family phosphoprotein [Sabulicella rubraurantiaca]
MSLSLPEEVLLLTLDEEGRPLGRQGVAAGLALAGAVLMELALAGRVDTDREALLLVSAEPTGDAAMDFALSRLPDSRDSRSALMLLAREEEALRGAAMAGLEAKGLLRRAEGRVLLLFRSRRWVPAGDRPEAGEVLARLRRALEGDHVPEPREALLVSLARAAGLLPVLLPPELLAARQERLDLLGRIEALGRSLGAAVAALRVARLGG